MCCRHWFLTWPLTWIVQNCTANAQCISWNINTGMKQCFLRGSWKPNPGKQCVSGQVRAVQPPPPPALDSPHDYVELPGPGSGAWATAPIHARHVRVTSTFMPAGGKFSLSGLRVFGTCPGPLPSLVTAVNAVRDKDPRKAHVSWAAAARAEFYIIRYGTRSTWLYGNCQVYSGTNFTIPSLNAGASYFVTVDSVGPSGLTKGTTIVPVKDHAGRA